MKIVLVCLTALCLLSTMAGAPPGDGLHIAEDARYALKVGETVTISVHEIPSTGYLWSYEISDGEVVEVFSERFLLDNFGNDLPGGDGGTREVTVKALKPGEAVMEMVNKRGDDEIGETRMYHFTVTME